MDTRLDGKKCLLSSCSWNVLRMKNPNMNITENLMRVVYWVVNCFVSHNHNPQQNIHDKLHLNLYILSQKFILWSYLNNCNNPHFMEEFQIKLKWCWAIDKNITTNLTLNITQCWSAYRGNSECITWTKIIITLYKLSTHQNKATLL